MSRVPAVLQPQWIGGEREEAKKQAAGSWLNLLASQILQPAT
jgi:hypothetical protein